MRGNAYGFRLEALLKVNQRVRAFIEGIQQFLFYCVSQMNDTKADRSKDAAVQSLLHYLVRVLIKKAPAILDFKNELPHLQAAAKCKTLAADAKSNQIID